MATLTGLIPVTVGTFQAYQGGGWQGGYHWGGGGGGGLGTQSAGPYIYIYPIAYGKLTHTFSSACCIQFRNMPSHVLGATLRMNRTIVQ